jgi:hypothetical protein
MINITASGLFCLLFVAAVKNQVAKNGFYEKNDMDVSARQSIKHSKTTPNARLAQQRIPAVSLQPIEYKYPHPNLLKQALFLLIRF